MIVMIGEADESAVTRPASLPLLRAKPNAMLPHEATTVAKTAHTTPRADHGLLSLCSVAKYR